MLRNTLNSLDAFKKSAYVCCERGDFTIFATKDNDGFIVNDIKENYGKPKPQYGMYTTAEIDQLIGYFGNITQFITVNHETDEETVVI